MGLILIIHLTHSQINVKKVTTTTSCAPNHCYDSHLVSRCVESFGPGDKKVTEFVIVRFNILSRNCSLFKSQWYLSTVQGIVTTKMYFDYVARFTITSVERMEKNEITKLQLKIVSIYLDFKYILQARVYTKLSIIK